MTTRSQWLVAGALLLSLVGIATAQIVQRPLNPGTRKSAGISYWTAASEPSVAADGELAVRSNGVGTASQLVLFDSSAGAGWQVLSLASSSGGTNNTIPVWNSVGALEDSVITDVSGVVTVTGTLITTGNLTLPDGDFTDPAIDFGSSTATYGWSTDVVSSRLSLSSAGNEIAAYTSLGVIMGSNGSAAAPNFTSRADTNTGMTNLGGDVLGFSTNGEQRINIANTLTTLTPPANGGNLDAGNYLQGLVRMEMLALGVLTDGTSANTEILIDDTPAEWVEVDAGTEVTVDTAETVVVRKGTNSLSIIWTDSAVDGDGVIHDLGADENWTAQESVGLWHRCTTTTTAGDLELAIIDTTATTDIAFPAIATANVWQWVELDIAALTGTTGDTVTDIEISLSGQGVAAGQAFDCFFDFGFLWDLADETAISRDVLVDGVVSLVTVVDAEGTANLMTNRVEGTDYIINYQSGDDVLVNVANNSTFTGMILVFLAEDPNP